MPQLTLRFKAQNPNQYLKLMRELNLPNKLEDKYQESDELTLDYHVHVSDELKKLTRNLKTLSSIVDIKPAIEMLETHLTDVQVSLLQLKCQRRWWQAPLFMVLFVGFWGFFILGLLSFGLWIWRGL